MSLRVIGGTFKGRRLEAPPGLDTRPLPDRIKQSLFDWLGQDLSGLAIADICAGSGSFSIEAFSRGATRVHLIEPGRHAAATVTTNLAAVGNPAAIIWHRRFFQSVLPTLSGLDLIFADPPFPWFSTEPETIDELLRLAAGCLAPTGTLIIRGERGQDLPACGEYLQETERREYGRSWIAALARR